jgi:hypothetical protein
MIPSNVFKEYNFSADFKTELGKMSPEPGAQLTPLPAVSDTESIIKSLYEGGITFVRMPEGSGCDYTMEKIFKNANADANDPKNYDFSKIDEIMSKFVLYFYSTSVFQGIYDYGENNCIVEKGIQKGHPTSDPEKWTNVLAGIIRHFNIGQGWKPNNWQVKFIEFLSDPFGKGGYQKGQENQVLAHFTKFAGGLSAKFVSENEKVLITGPSYAVSSVDELADSSTFLPWFIQKVASGKIPLDILSIQTRCKTPYEHYLIATRIREILNSAGLNTVKIMDSGIAVDSSVWSGTDGKNEKLDLIATAAHLISTLILYQNTVDFAIFSRPGFYETLDTLLNVITREDIFFNASGGKKIPLLAMFPFYFINDDQAIRMSLLLKTDNQISSPNDMKGMAALIAKSKDGKKIHFILSDTGTKGNYALYAYKVELQNIPSQFVTVEYKRARVNAGSTNFIFTDSGALNIYNGKFVFSKDDMLPPAVEYVMFELK